MLSAAQTGLKYIIPILYTKFLLFASEIAYIFRGDTLFFGNAAQDGCLMERLTAFMREMCVFSGIFSVFRAKFNVFDQIMSEIWAIWEEDFGLYGVLAGWNYDDRRNL